jgi:hypothetical protein
MRAASGAALGMYLGLFFALFSLFDDSELSMWRITLSLVAGGAVGGAVYGIGLPTASHRLGATLLMTVSASVGCMIAFYGCQFSDFVGLGAFCGVALGLTHGLLGWKPTSTIRP